LADMDELPKDPDASPLEAAAALLTSAESGDRRAPRQLVAVLYDELRRMARRQRAREGRQLTLHTTELVHEAYLRIADDSRVTARGRAYFMGAAAQAMRRVLIDAARRRSSDKRGGDPVRVTLGEGVASVNAYASDLIDLDRALSALEGDSPRLARTVECRFFSGMTVEETAEALGVSARTVKGDWALARAWLYDAMGGRDPS
jgi:RNA polymerase sigma-70 factor, ECF subfamily